MSHLSHTLVVGRISTDCKNFKAPSAVLTLSCNDIRLNDDLYIKYLKYSHLLFNKVISGLQIVSNDIQNIKDQNHRIIART